MSDDKRVERVVTRKCLLPFLHISKHIQKIVIISRMFDRTGRHTLGNTHDAANVEKHVRTEYEEYKRCSSLNHMRFSSGKLNTKRFLKKA